MAPSFSGSNKRPLEMVVYAAAAAAANARDDDEETSASTSTSPNAAALFLLAASAPPPFGDLEPISAVPISAVPPQLPPHPWTTRSPVAGREEPPCLRRHFLLALGLRADLPVHFIDAKCLTATDLDPHQNRLRIPRDGTIHRLRPLLTPAELHDANLFFLPDPAPKPKRRSAGKQQQQQQQSAAEAEPQNDGASASSSAAAETETKKIKKPKAKGKVHGGLRVRLVNLDAGAKDLLLSRWESSRGTIVKGEGYLDFIRDQCGFKAKDAVEVWAFVQRRFRIFGIFGDSLLHVLIVKKDDEQPQRCRYCRHPPAPAANPSIMSS
ncbi:unnamed protein product [Miscanthus lutarioriparius]|uniref:Uncharacterized protein n=1 Tax=Miscanthus lutarioriparius TaxID=422564 RepID=A0A811NZC7_9POAL|nr:unnamed protein product [Miscanthus lutarioriparius]